MAIFKSLNDWRNKHLLAADLIVATISFFTIVIVCLWKANCRELEMLFSESRTAIYTTMASITGSLLGFILTAVSLIAVFLQTPRFLRLLNSGAGGSIFRIYMVTTRWLSVTTVWILLAIVFDTEKNPQLWIMAIAVYLATISAACLWRCIWTLEKIIDIASTSLTETQPIDK